MMTEDQEQMVREDQPTDVVVQPDLEESKIEALLQQYFAEVYRTSIIRFDKSNFYQRITKGGGLESMEEMDDEEESPGGQDLLAFPEPEVILREIDVDAPLPRHDVFTTPISGRLSKLTSLDKKGTRDDLVAAVAKLRGEEVEEEVLEKHEKPRTGCEGFCIPGLCKGATCRHPLDNYPLLRGVANCMGICLTRRTYDALKVRRTADGATIDDCIQYGVDQWKWTERTQKMALPGVIFPLNVGCLAPDAESYKVFHELFESVLSIRHNRYPRDALHPRDCNPRHVPDVRITSGGRYVVWCSVQASRNIRGYPFAPRLTRAERGDITFAVNGVLDELEGELKGKHYELDELPNDELPFFHDMEGAPLRPNPLIDPQLARDWPRGRSIWAIEGGRFYIYKHGRDHLSFVSFQDTSDIHIAFIRFLKIFKTLEQRLHQSHLDFVFDQHLGHLTSFPSNVGTAMTFLARIRLPSLSGFPLFDTILTRLRLVRRPDFEAEPDAPLETAGHAHVPPVIPEEAEAVFEVEEEEKPCQFTICNIDRLGVSEVESYVQFVDSVNKLIEMEQMLTDADVVHQESFPIQMRIEFNDLQRISDDSCQRAEEVDFVKHVISSDLPDLDENKTVMAEVLKEQLSIYEQLQDKSSKEGFPFRSVIQVGVDHPQGHVAIDHPQGHVAADHPQGPQLFRNEIAKVGAVVGDEDCYHAFHPFFRSLIPARHSNYREDGFHSTNFDLNGIEVDNHLDLHYVHEIRIEASRNIRGFRLPPSNTRVERRLLERIVNHCLGFLEHKKIDFEVKGRYIQYSHATMAHLKQSIDEMRIRCIYFPVENRILHKQAGLLRDWPDGRGVWVNSEGTLFCNINEVDHMTFTSVEKSNKMEKVFTNHKLILEVFEERLQEIAGHTFMKDPHLGYITTCPGNLGTGMVVSVHLKLHSLFKNRRFFERVLRKHHLGCETVSDGVWAVYNLDSLGFPENEILWLMHEGCKKIIELDKFLTQRESDDWVQDENLLPLKTIAHLIHCDMSWFSGLTFDDEDDDELGEEDDEMLETEPRLNLNFSEKTE